VASESYFWLIRHAPVDGPCGVVHGPDAPPNLRDTAALSALTARLPPNAFAVCSPARRTRETAVSLGLNPLTEVLLREQDFGSWTGRRHSELVTELGDSYREFWKAPASNRPPSGESFVDQIARTNEALASMPSGDVILVVHSGTVRAALAVALDLSPEAALRFIIDPLSLTRIDRLERGWRVVAVNRVA